MKNKIKFYRENIGITQVQLAEKAGVSKDYVSMIEREERSPGFALGLKLARILGTTIGDLFFEEQANLKYDDDIIHEDTT